MKSEWNNNDTLSSESRVQEKSLKFVAALGGDVRLVQPAHEVHGEYVPVILSRYVSHDALLGTHVFTVGLE